MYTDRFGDLQIDVEGACLAGVCRYCDPSGNPVICDAQAGMNSDRVCVYPGSFSTFHKSTWTSGTYYETPINVWLAIFFVMFLFMILIQLLMCVRHHRNHGWNPIK